MQSALSRGVSSRILLVPHRIITFLTDDGKAKLMALYRTFSMRSPPVSKFSAFIGAKYQFHILGYLLGPARMESSNRRVLGFESLIIEQWLR